jgi:hypothetical protein
MTDHHPDPASIPAEVVAFYRRLDEQATDRLYFRAQDPEEEQGLWLWEAVPVQDEVVAVKQIQVAPDGTVSRYWWQWMQDDRGFLTDQPLDPQIDDLDSISAEEFRRHWEP